MSTPLGESTPKARKDHRCYWCGQLIKKGTRYHHWAGVSYGEFYDTKVHLECGEAWRLLPECDAEEVPYAAYHRGCTCERNRCECEPSLTLEAIISEGVEVWDAAEMRIPDGASDLA